jgi:hypothetical protein
LVKYKDTEPVTLKPVITVGKQHGPSKRVKLPGPEDAYLTLVNIDAGSKMIGLVYQDTASSADISPPAVIAEVSIKPGMTVLWLGTLLILLGGSIGIARRWQK